MRDWWFEMAASDFEEMAPKIKAYSAYDLKILGHILLDMLGWDDQPERTGAELGCFFYLAGKIARMAGAYRDKELPSEDTLHDITVYSLMIRRIRESGDWPGV